MGSGLLSTSTTLSVVALAASIGLYRLRNPPRPNVPIKSYEYHYVDNFFPPEIADILKRRVAEEGVYHTALDDATSYYEHIGEAAPLDDPVCNHPYMVPNKNRTLCMLPQRFDVGRHHLLTGGRTGAKERYKPLVSRLSSFLAYLFDDLETDLFRAHLFDSPKYRAKADRVCKGRTVMDPIQLNLVIMLPGQELAQHFDAPWFWGANRFTHPQWLLVAMAGSGLWEDRLVPQIQGLVWLHKDGTPDNSGHGGQFYFYPDGPAGDMVEVNSTFNSMLVLDGCRVIHGVNRFHPERSVPYMNKKAQNELRHEGGVWNLYSDKDKVRPRPRSSPRAALTAPARDQIGTYQTEELRVSLVWRARCFETDDERQRWQAHVDAEERIPIDEVLDKLEQDLRRRGRIAPGQPRPPHLEFADMLMREYAPYPVANRDKAFIPWNYCAVERIAPEWSRPFLNPILDLLCE